MKISLSSLITNRLFKFKAISLSANDSMAWIDNVYRTAFYENRICDIVSHVLEMWILCSYWNFNFNYISHFDIYSWQFEIIFVVFHLDFWILTLFNSLNYDVTFTQKCMSVWQILLYRNRHKYQENSKWMDKCMEILSAHVPLQPAVVVYYSRLGPSLYV